MKGIDVSYANGSINWQKVKQSKMVDFAIIRSTFGSDLPSQTDSFFFQNASGCVKNNIPFGIYHFAYFINKQKAIDEANFAIRKANEYKKYVKFIALDIEEDSERYADRVGAKPNWTECAVAFCETVKKAGYIPVIYSNQSWLTYKLDFDKIKKYKLWYAAPYASKPKYTCSIWQNAWNGRIPGIIGDVDTNICYDEALFKNTPSTSTATATPKKTKTVKELADEVIAGKWGVDEDRKNRLTKAGYDYYKVQAEVNKILLPKRKTVNQLATEVIQGKWGAGQERYKLLTAAGYDYDKVQAEVNKRMKGVK